MREPGTPRPTAGILLRLPEAGKVKTRLARTLGDARAARIYAGMARGLVDRLCGGPWDLVIHHTPSTPSAAREVARWLEGTGPSSPGAPPLRYLPQPEGDLGMRIEAALSRGTTPGAPSAVLASDVPGLGPRHLAETFRVLGAGEAELVVGPCPDGGYYLLAVARLPPPPSLFRAMPWSTDQVLATTLDRAREAGLRVHLLEPLHDVDEEKDLEAAGLPLPK